jgi:hypothetical protein
LQTLDATLDAALFQTFGNQFFGDGHGVISQFGVWE